MNEDLQMTEDLDVSECVEEVEVAEPLVEEINEGEVETESEPTTEEKEAPVEETSFDRNAIAAAARRKAEKAAKEAQEAIDAEYVRRFGDLTNPETGKPIRSQRDYLDALDAQERLKVREQFKANGIDTSMLEKYIESSPQMKEAKELKERLESLEAEKRVMADIAELNKIDNAIKSIEDVPSEVIDLCANRGFTLTEAYKILNYGKTTEAKNAATVQRAVNQVKSKSHLNPMNGVSINDTSVDIPSNERAMWEAAFPNKSYAEIKKLYNNQL